MVGVVAIHAFEPTRSFENKIVPLFGWTQISDYLLFTISQAIARLSVPAFYVLAGLFLFAKIGYGDLQSWMCEMKRRVRTLLIPFVLWNVGLYFLIFLLQLAQIIIPVPDSRVGLVTQYSLSETLALILGINGPPIEYQFWFIRDLILACALSFILVFASQKVLLWITCVLGFVWLGGVAPNSIPSLASLFFLCVGAVFGRSRKGDVLENMPLIIPVCYLTIVLIEYFIREQGFYPVIHRTGLFLGVLSLFWISKFIALSKFISNQAARLANSSFFLFAFHEPLLTLLKKFLLKFVRDGFSAFAIYALLIALTSVISIVIFYRLRSIIPRSMLLLTGGR